MKKIIPVSILVLYILLSGFDDIPSSFFEYEPIFMNRSEMESGVRLVDPRGIRNPGKIYTKGSLIFINEKYLGIHVIDNSNPESPKNVAFIRIDGSIDMAIKGNVLYADNAVDLIAIRINPEFAGIEVTSRVKNVFPELVAPDGRGLSRQEEMARPKNSILVRWREK
ncbi:hypothetical protein MNBD_BACTEROID01-2143 [hydrothermal vent metagenome]|uniref:Uncharacterized protein n=1 Tax=hydrothermal vent metagenome TaxID=652676 RepID=A0A3B0U3F4_9ZZZZ